MLTSLFAKTGRIVRLMLRRDRLRIPVWLMAISAVTWLIALSFTDLYQTEEERQAMAETMLNPAMTAMFGPGYGLDNYTNGAMMAHQMLLMTAIVVGIMSILLVVRHTRADEEDGRLEMLRSLPSGRLSHLSATLIVVLGTNVLLALLIGFGLSAFGIESMDLEGSLLYGAALGAAGIFFAALTVLFAQLAESSRGALGLSMAVLLIAYLVRAVGDVGHETLSWFSPFGWIIGTEVYVNNYWWPIVLTLGASLILVVLALYLNALRDLGAGFLPSRPGRTRASSYLQSPFGLALRLQRTGLIAWAIGMFVLGASYGSVFGDLESFFEEIDMMADLLTPVEGFSLTEQFITMLMSIMSMICTLPALMALFKLRGEEKKNRTEHLLARAVPRVRLLGSYFVVAMIVSFVMLSLAVIGLWSAGTAVMDEPLALGTFYSAGLVYLPAMWVMIGLAVMLVGWAPKLTGLTWMYVAYSFVVVYLGGILQFPEWLSAMSPFGHIPQIPVEDMDWLKTTILTIIALVVICVGFAGYQRRDIDG